MTGPLILHIFCAEYAQISGRFFCVENMRIPHQKLHTFRAEIHRYAHTCRIQEVKPARKNLHQMVLILPRIYHVFYSVEKSAAIGVDFILQIHRTYPEGAVPTSLSGWLTAATYQAHLY